MKRFDHRSGQHLDIDGARIYVERVGEPDRPCLVLLHGGIGTLADFNAAVPALCADFQLLGIDSRGHGRSTLGPGGLSYQRMQHDVETVLQQLRIERPCVLGFSDGGIVGYRLAAAGVVPIAKLATIGATWHQRHIEPVKDLFATVTARSWREKFPRSFDTYQALNPEPDFERLLKAAVAMWLDTGDSGHPNDSIRDIACPAWAARGDDDHLVALKVLQELADTLKDRHLLNVPFAGHEAHIDQTEIVTLSLRRFLRP